MKKVVAATSNKGKLLEMREILSSAPIELIAMGEIWNPVPQIDETGFTFFENAFIKADWVYKNSGLWALADDSGLEVDSLGGRPGVFSARFAGESAQTIENNRKLLHEMQNVPALKRTARFRCVVVLKTGPDSFLQSEGVCEGRIGFELCGAAGFGYDPLFIPDGFEKTFAQLSSAEKHQLSHRGKALKSLVEKIDAILL